MHATSSFDGVAANGTIDVRFSFRDSHLANGQQLFETGTKGDGTVARIVGSIAGSYYLVLAITPWQDSALHVVLASHVVEDKWYHVRLRVENETRITAWLDGAEQFTYETGAPEIVGQFDHAVVGGGPTTSDNGGPAVSGFEIRYVVRGAPESDSAQLLLLLLAGLLTAVIAVFGLMQAVVYLTNSTRRKSSWRDRVSRLHLNSHRVALGVIALAAGVVLLEILTPTEDAVVQETGSQTWNVAAVRPDHVFKDYLADEPEIYESASAVDMTLAFQLRIIPPAGGKQFIGAPDLVFTGYSEPGVHVWLTPGRALAVSIPVPDEGGGSSESPQVSYALPYDVWERVKIVVLRSRSVQILVDGQQAWSYTYSSPAFAVAPTTITAGETFSPVRLRKLSLGLTLYAPPTPATIVFLTRSGQAFAFILALAGVIVLCGALLRKLVPEAIGGRRPLVLVAFGVAGVGEVANFLVDQIHTQISPNPYIPRNSWLFISDARFSDFLQVFEIFRSLNPYGVQSGSYPPIGYWLVAPFVWMSQYAALLAFIAVFGGFFFWWISRSFMAECLRHEKVLILIIASASYPITFAVDRGNVDLFVFILLALGICAFEQQSELAASSLLGLAAAAKIVPALYLLLYLRGRRRTALLYALVVASGSSFLAILGFNGTLSGNIHGLQAGLEAVGSIFTGGVVSTATNTTLTAWAQSLGFAVLGPVGDQAAANVAGHLITIEEVVGTLALAWYLRQRETSLWRGVTLITIAVLLLPQVSYSYSLIDLFIPLALFARHAPSGPRTIRIAVLFGLLLAPKVYFYLGVSGIIDSSVLLTPPLLIALAVAVIHDGAVERRCSKTMGLSREVSPFGSDSGEKGNPSGVAVDLVR